MKVAGITRRTPADDAAPAVLRDTFARFQADATTEFHALGLDGALDFSLTADMRFVGQAFEIPVDIEPAILPRLTAADLAERFTAAHRRVYFHGGEPGRRVEIVGLRCGVRRRLEALPEFRERPTTLIRPSGIPVRIGSETVTAALRDAAGLPVNETISGPALIEGYSSSIWVPPGWTARRDTHGNILMQGTAA
jgi:N-methylhydantoinase A